jgi:hypothetical protein
LVYNVDIIKFATPGNDVFTSYCAGDVPIEVLLSGVNIRVKGPGSRVRTKT